MLIRKAVRKKGDYVGKIPKGGGRGDQNPSIFFSVFSNSGAYNKSGKKCGNSQTGGGGSATWEFFPHNPVFFFLTAFLSQSTHCPGSVVPLTMCQYDPLLKENGD